MGFPSPHEAAPEQSEVSSARRLSFVPPFAVHDDNRDPGHEVDDRPQEEQPSRNKPEEAANDPAVSDLGDEKRARLPPCR